MSYRQFSREHLLDCMANQSALIDQFYKELQVKRRIKREKALQQMEKAKAKAKATNIK